MPELSPTRFTMVPARRSNEPTARRRTRRILGALFLAAALSVVSVFIALAKGREETDLSSVTPEGRDLAHRSAVTYLMGGPLNVPHANTFRPEDAVAADGRAQGERPPALSYQSLNWVGFSPQTFGSKKAGITKFEVHHFLVTLPPAQATQNNAGNNGARAAGAPSPSSSPSGSARPSQSASPAPTASPTTQAPGSQAPASPGPSPSPSGSASAAPNVVGLDVSILLTVKGPRLAAAPAFTARRVSDVDDPAGVGDYSNYNTERAEVSDSVKNQIAQWAKAYATGDSVTLGTLTGDQNSSHKYTGLTGFTVPNSPQAVQTLSAIKVNYGDGGRALVVRTRVLLARADGGGTVSGGNPATQFTSFADFDLLIGAPSGARPPVLAWGPAGSAAQLKPYSNAIRQ